MKTNKTNNSVNVNVVVTGAKSEVKAAKKSPLFILHLLEKMAKKQINVNGDTTDLATLLKMCGGKFTFANIDTDKRGTICKRVPLDAKKHFGLQTIDTYLGAYALVPVATTENGLLESIKARLNYLATVEKDLSSNKKAKRTTEHDLLADYQKGLIDGNTFAQRLAKLLAA